MHRVYYPLDNFPENNLLSLNNREEVHHLHHVLRAKKKETVFLFNGKGKEAIGEILDLTAKNIRIKILSQKSFQQKKPAIVLACAIPKKGKFELIIEKATELGAQEIVPLITERSNVQLKKERAKQKQKRYQTVAVNASKQCQRSFIPTIHAPTEFKSYMENLDEKTVRIIPSLGIKRQNLLHTLSEIDRPTKICVFIGPEGDFSPEEYQFALAHESIPVSLGETVLKVETAALCALSGLHLFYHGE